MQLECAADSRIPIARQDGEHMAVQISRTAGFHAGDGEAEADEAVTIEGPKALPADFPGSNKKPHREELEV
jgi:hypothetical protein